MIVKPSVLTPQKIVVGSEGDLVTITVGNSTMKMGYEDALRFSQMIRLRAKSVKHSVGDRSRHWSVAGQIDGLDEKGNPI